MQTLTGLSTVLALFDPRDVRCYERTGPRVSEPNLWAHRVAKTIPPPKRRVRL